MTTMKAIRVHETGGPDVLQLKEIPIPKPRRNEVLIRVKAVGVNADEAYVRAGILPPQKLPYTPGFECAGIVDDLGTEVKDFRRGDRVYVCGTTTGAYAEYAVAEQHNVHPLAEGATFAQGAILPVSYFTAYRALFHRAHSKEGEMVLVHGANSGVGIAAVQFARAYGMTVIGTAGTPAGIELVQKAGAHFVFNHRESDYLKEVKKAAGENRIDVIVEQAADRNLGNDLTLLGSDGRIAVVGRGGSATINPGLTIGIEANILGVVYFKATDSQLEETHKAIEKGLKNGWLRPIISKQFPLEKAADAHAAITSGGGAYGRIVLNVD